MKRYHSLLSALLIALLLSALIPFRPEKVYAYPSFTIIQDWDPEDTEEFQDNGTYYAGYYIGAHTDHIYYMLYKAGEIPVESTGDGYHIYDPGSE